MSSSPSLEVVVAGDSSTGVRLLILLAGVEFAIAAVNRSPGGVLAAFGAACAAAYLHRKRTRPVTLRADSDGLSMTPGDKCIRWSDMDSVVCHARGGTDPERAAVSGAVSIFHAGGEFRLPAPGADFVRSGLFTRIIVNAGLANRPQGLPPALAAQYEESVRHHGADRVFATTGETRRAGKGSGARVRVAMLFLGIPAIGAAFFPGDLSGPGFTGANLLIVFFTLMHLLTKHGAADRSKSAGCGLVMDPDALYIEGGKICAKLDWSDLISVSKKKPTSFELSSSQIRIGLLLKMRGADFVVTDIYRCPLFEVKRRLELFHGEALAGIPPSIPKSFV